MTKDELLSEVEKRRSIGRVIDISETSTKADIEAALALDDEDAENTKADNDAEGLPEGIPFTDSQPEDVALSNADFKGRYINKADGETYALAIIPNDVRGKTHKLKNTVHFTEGNEDWFRLNFDKA